MSKIEAESSLVLQFMNRYKVVVIELVKISIVLSYEQVIIKFLPVHHFLSCRPILEKSQRNAAKILGIIE